MSWVVFTTCCFFFYIYASESYLLSIKSKSLAKILHLSCQWWWSLIEWYRLTFQPSLILECNSIFSSECAIAFWVLEQQSAKITLNSQTILIERWVSPVDFYLNLVVIIHLEFQQYSYLMFYANITISFICSIPPMDTYNFNTFYGIKSSKMCGAFLTYLI